MQNNVAIKVNDLTKFYKLYDKPTDRVKESLNPFGKVYHKEFYALNGVSFAIHRGETIGIIGKNGSGKSTLLKMITGTTRPSGVSTAMPIWKYFFRISFSPLPSSDALNCGNAFSAATTALI